MSLYNQVFRLTAKLEKGDPAPVSTPESMRDVLSAVRENLPLMAEAITKTVPGYEQSMLDAAKVIQPQYSQNQLDLYKEFGPQVNEVGSQMAETNARRQAGYESDILKNEGLDLVKAAQEAQQVADPEFYKLREAGANKTLDLLNSMDPNKLTPGTAEEIQRNVNRQNVNLGTGATPTSTESINAAMNFGQGLNQQRSALSGVLANLPNLMQTSRSGVDVMQQAVGRGSAPAYGQNNVMGYSQTPFGQPVSQMATSIMGTAGNLEQQKAGNQFTMKSGAEKGGEMAMSAVNSFLSGCCFIFMEAYNGQLPWFVRFWRDKFAPENTDRRNGYIRMAKWLVPLMQSSKVIRFITNTLMIKPMTRFGGWRVAEEGYNYNPVDHLINNFWFKVWSIYGKGVK